MEHNVVGWFEVPVTDMERAMRFYAEVFGVTLERHELGELDMAWFPWLSEKYGSGGCLVKNEHYTPSTEGPLVYFTAHSGDLTNELAKVEAAGGTVLREKFPIGEHGFVGLFLDTEGNRIAMHSRR